MRAAGKLIAWIEMKAGGEVVGAFLGETLENSRLPAKRVCSSPQEAYVWIEHEATKLGLPVKWVSSWPDLAIPYWQTLDGAQK